MYTITRHEVTPLELHDLYDYYRPRPVYLVLSVIDGIPLVNPENGDGLTIEQVRIEIDPYTGQQVVVITVWGASEMVETKVPLTVNLTIDLVHY